MAIAKKKAPKKAVEKAPKKAVKKVESTEILSPFDEMEQMLDQYFSRNWLRPFRMEWPSFSRLAAPFEGKTPSVDVIDRDNDIVVKAELPGVEKKDIDISITQNSVTLKATTSHEEEEEKGEYHRREISRGSFSRTLPLPTDVDEAKAKAKYQNGVLELTLPKIKETKRRSIEIE